MQKNMARMHGIKVKVHPPKQTHTSGNAEKQIASAWTVEKRCTKATIKPLRNKHKSISSDKSISQSTDVITSLEFEKEQQKMKRDLREKLFKKILSNEKVGVNVLKFLFYILGTIVVCTASTFVFTLIPLHNVILNSSYWYELLPMLPFGCTWAGLMMIYFSSSVLNISYTRRNCRILEMCLVMSVESILLTVTMYGIWTYGLHYQFPIPWHIYIVNFLVTFTAQMLLWIRFPLEWKTNVTFRKRFKMYVLMSILHLLTIQFQYNVGSMLLLRYQNTYQPILAVLLVGLREINSWVIEKSISKMACGDESGGQFVGSTTIGITHGVMVCYVIGSSATLPTAILLLGIDFAINIYLGVRTIWVRKRRCGDIQTQSDLLQELARNELIEFLVPLVYLIALVSAYYGPNSMLIGTVGATIWHYVAIENIQETIIIILALFLADLSSTIINSVMLWVCCKINLLKAIIVVAKEYGDYICCNIGLCVFAVSIDVI